MASTIGITWWDKDANGGRGASVIVQAPIIATKPPADLSSDAKITLRGHVKIRKPDDTTVWVKT